MQYSNHMKQSLSYQIAHHTRSIEVANPQGPSTPLHNYFTDPNHHMSIQLLEVTTPARYDHQLSLYEMPPPMGL